MPIASKKKKSEEEQRMASIVFQMPEELADKIHGRLGESDEKIGKDIDSLREAMKILGSSLHRGRMEAQSSLLQHKNLSKQEITKHRNEVDQVVQELDEAFKFLWPKFEVLEKSVRDGDSEQAETSKKHAKDLIKHAEEVVRLTETVEKRYQSSLKKMHVSRGEISAEFKTEIARIDKLLKAIGKYEYGSSLNVLSAGSPIGFTGVLNFKSGFTVVINGAQVDVSASGAGSTPLIPTGSVNGLNATYGVASKPSAVVSDGITYYEGHGYSYAALNITMDIPPSEYIRYYA